jgi:rRNA processing protein Krr1/Pno1
MPQRELPIPTKIPAGVVIGKKGAVCKGIQDRFQVRMTVDTSNHAVRLSSSRSHNIDDAVK